MSAKPMFSYYHFHLLYHTEIWKRTRRKLIVTLLGFPFSWGFLYTIVYNFMLLLVCYWLAVLATSEMLCFNRDQKIDKFDESRFPGIGFPAGNCIFKVTRYYNAWLIWGMYSDHEKCPIISPTKYLLKNK